METHNIEAWQRENAKVENLAMWAFSVLNHPESRNARKCAVAGRSMRSIDLDKAEQWADLKSFAIVERERTVGTNTSCERRYYISSLPADAKRIAHAVRSHWEVEYRLH